MDPDPIDQAAIDHLLEITGGDLEFLDELVDTYLSDAVVQLDGMRRAAADGDAAAMVRPAHSLKSSSENVGATALADGCRTLEADAKAGAVPDAVARVAGCDDAFTAASSALLAQRIGR